MSAIINNSFRKFQADNFIDSFTETDANGALKSNMYLAIGKNDVWSGTTADNLSEFRVTSSPTASALSCATACRISPDTTTST